MIYLITNTVNNKKYVGKTSQGIIKRFYQHCRAAEYQSQTHLHRAIRKYGKDMFVVEQLDDTYSNEAERLWILKIQPEYNMTAGGDGGWINDQTGNTWTVKDSSNMGMTFRTGHNHSSKWREAVTGGNNYQCNYIIHTPWGEFDTWTAATRRAKELRNGGRRDVITDRKTLTLYCKQDIMLSKEGRRTYPDWRGKSTKDLGFDVEYINGSN